jgi:pyrroline-5-carboxylate reductase
MIVVDEKLMSCVTCASGSSPAYVYMFIEALADGVVKYGMPREIAYEFVAATVEGAAKMVLETKEHPGRLKDMVCSRAEQLLLVLQPLRKQVFGILLLRQ